MLAAHLVHKDELEKAIRFLKSLVETTEAATKVLLPLAYDEIPTDQSAFPNYRGGP